MLVLQVVNADRGGHTNRLEAVSTHGCWPVHGRTNGHVEGCRVWLKSVA